MNSFFLSGSLPPNAEGSAEPCEAKGASVSTHGRTFKSCTLCQILHYEAISFYYITVIAVFTTVQE